jgi:hypothetical protein
VQSVYSQGITIKDIIFGGGYHIGESSANSFRLIYKTLGQDKTQSVFRKLDFNNKLEVTDTSLITMRGNFRLITSTTGLEYAACIFISTEPQSVILHFSGKNNYERSVQLKLLAPWKKKKMTMLLYPSTNPNEFYVIYNANDSMWEILCYDIYGDMRWKKLMTDNQKKLTVRMPMTFGKDLMMLVSHINSKRPSHELTQIEHSTGEIVQSKVLANENENLIIDNIIYKDSVLYLTGRKFIDRKVNDKYTGTPFVKYLERGMDAPEDILLNASLSNMYFYWMDIAKDAEGNKYLVGETFTAESSGTHTMRMVATGILTLGMLMVTWQNMTLNEFLYLPIDQSESLPKMVKIEPKKVTVGGYLKPYYFIRYAYNSGQVRYLSNSDRGNVYLLNGNIVKRFNLSTQSASDAAYTTGGGTPSVFFSSDRYLILFNLNKSVNLLELKMVNLK